MSNFDLIAFDMDGTLLNSSKQITEESIRAINEAASLGKVVALSTGRCVSELEAYLPLLPSVRYLITISGALIYDTLEKKAIYRKPIPSEILREMVAIAAPRDQLVQLMNEGTIIQKNRFEYLPAYHMEQYGRLYETTSLIVDDLLAHFRAHPTEVCKFNIFARSETDRLSMLDSFKSYPLSIVLSEVTGLECTPLSVSKGYGLKILCDTLGIPISRSIAVGDADNDLDIIRTAGLGIAMGNANENVLKAADVVISDCDHEGCAEAIRKYLL